VKAF